MSMEQDQARLLAERIARRVSQGEVVEKAQPLRAENAGGVVDELAALRASLEEMQQRLVQIESHVARADGDSRTGRDRQSNEQGSVQRPSQSSASGGARSPWLSGMYVPAAHPSQEKFGVEEAAVSELVDFFEGEKRCELEPGGKPCDHCAMCSTRGF